MYLELRTKFEAEKDHFIQIFVPRDKHTKCYMVSQWIHIDNEPTNNQHYVFLLEKK